MSGPEAASFFRLSDGTDTSVPHFAGWLSPSQISAPCRLWHSSHVSAPTNKQPLLQVPAAAPVPRVSPATPPQPMRSAAAGCLAVVAGSCTIHATCFIPCSLHFPISTRASLSNPLSMERRGEQQGSLNRQDFNREVHL